MRRKLVKQGYSTYTISLPKEWVERFNLKEGDEIDLEEEQTKIIVSNIKSKENYNSINFNLENINEKIIPEFIVSLYKGGFNDINLTNLNNKTKIIKDSLSGALGFEILGSESNQLHLVDLGNSDEESISKAEQQIFWRLLNMIDRIADEKSKDEEIKQIDQEINRLSFFIQRNISRKFSNNPKNFMLYEKAYALELLGDFLRSFKIYSDSNKKDKEFLKVLPEILDKLRSQKTTLEDFELIKKRIIDLRAILKNTSKNKDSSFSLILILKTLKQLFDVSLTLKLLDKKNDLFE